MIDGMSIAIIIAIGLPIILGSLYIFIDNAFQKDCEKKYGGIYDSSYDYLKFYYKNRLDEQEVEYRKKIDELYGEINELEDQVKLQDNTIRVLYDIIKECLTDSIKENNQIIKELDKLGDMGGLNE